MTKALQAPPDYAALLKDIKERVRTAHPLEKGMGLLMFL